MIFYKNRIESHHERADRFCFILLLISSAFLNANIYAKTLEKAGIIPQNLKAKANSPGASVSLSAGDQAHAAAHSLAENIELAEIEEDLIRLTVTQPLPNEGDFRLALNQGKIFLFTARGQPHQLESALLKLLGSGTPAEAALVYQVGQELVVHTVHQVKVSNKDGLQQLSARDIDTTKLNQDINTALKRARSALANSAANDGVFRLASGERYVPIINERHLISASNLSCNVKRYIDVADEEDLCAGGASVSLDFVLSRMRTVNGAGTENAKFFRISLTDDFGAGAGIKLADNQSEINTWYESNPARNIRRGPILQRFEAEAYPYSGADGVTLVYHQPENVNPNVVKSFSTGIRLGVTAEGQLGTDGPKVAGGASFLFTDTRTVTIDHREYRIENSTSTNTAKVAWDHGDPCLYTFGDINFGCAYSRPLWYGGPIYNPDLFTSISYRNFVPKLDFVYRADPFKRGSTSFYVATRLTPAAYYGLSRYAGLWNALGSSGWFGYVLGWGFSYTVDWDHPVFQPEANVALQSLTSNNTCLLVENGSAEPGTRVIGAPCLTQRSQMWGLDAEERYHSRVNPDRCLTVSDSNQLVLDVCSSSLTQKWYWQGDQLVTRKAEIAGFALTVSPTEVGSLVPAGTAGASFRPYLSSF